MTQIAKNGVYIYHDLQTDKLTPCNNLKRLTELFPHVSYCSVNNWFRRMNKKETYEGNGYLIHNEHVETSRRIKRG